MNHHFNTSFLYELFDRIVSVEVDGYFRTIGGMYEENVINEFIVFDGDKVAVLTPKEYDEIELEVYSRRYDNLD